MKCETENGNKAFKLEDKKKLLTECDPVVISRLAKEITGDTSILRKKNLKKDQNLFNEYQLAELLHKSVYEIKLMSVKEYNGWIAYFNIKDERDRLKKHGKKGLKFTISAVDRTKAVFKGVGKSVRGLSSAVFSLKGALVGLGGAVVIRSIARTNAQFEDLRSGLASVFGSVEEGNKRFREISDFATRTQFSVEDLTKAFITLKGAGIEPTEKLLTTFTDTSASAVDGLGVFEALTRVIARSVGGGLGLEELNQIFDRGIPVFTILTEQLGITRLEVSELGKTAEGSEKIIECFNYRIRQRFGGATQKRLSNLNVAFSNFGIALRNFQDIIGESGFGQALKNVTSTLTDAISDSDGLAKAIGRVLANVFNKIDESLKSFRETGLDNLKEFLIKATLLTEAFVNNFKAGLESVANAFIDIRNALVFFKEDLKPISIAKSDFSDLVEFIRQIQFETKKLVHNFKNILVKDCMVIF